MNYLELVNRARLECGVSGSDLTTLQASLSGEDRRFKAWVAAAWMDVQSHKKDWGFLVGDITFNTVAAQGAYATNANPVLAAAPLLKLWDRTSLRCFPTSEGISQEQFLPVLDLDSFRDYYEFGAQRAQTGRPIVAAVDRTEGLHLGPAPDGVYTVVGRYYKKPQAIGTANDAEPTGLPDEYHMMLVYRTMMSYGSYEGAGEEFRRGKTEYDRLLRRLEDEFLPEVTVGPPLA